jgi:putative membrane protein
VRLRGVVVYREQGPGSGDTLLGLFVRFAVNGAALWIASLFVRGFDIGSWRALVVGAAIFGIVNALVRPVLFWLTCLLQILTLGLFTLLLNAAMLALTGWAAGELGVDFTVDGFWAAFLGALVVSVVSTVLTRFSGRWVQTLAGQ